MKNKEKINLFGASKIFMNFFKSILNFSLFFFILMTLSDRSPDEAIANSPLGHSYEFPRG
jgi:hypothetical protein